MSLTIVLVYDIRRLLNVYEECNFDNEIRPASLGAGKRSMPGGCAIPADLNARPARTVSALPSTGDVIRAIEDLVGQGADTVYFHLYGPGDVEHVRLLGSEVVSRFLPAAVPPRPL